MTNRSTRALFHSKTLNTALRAFSFPQDMEVRRQKLGRWIDALKTGKLPIAPPTDSIRAEVEPIVSRLIEIAKTNQETHRDVLHWL
ncbi:hypothetical protein [Microcoleus sp. F4-D5]|uniref:hypothetical protein n=1 Tax=Microcoleus sp. F4-D5 TaxID=2818760 RepID=UPI002FD33EEF